MYFSQILPLQFDSARGNSHERSKHRSYIHSSFNVLFRQLHRYMTNLNYNVLLMMFFSKTIMINNCSLKLKKINVSLKHFYRFVNLNFGKFFCPAAVFMNAS